MFELAIESLHEEIASLNKEIASLKKRGTDEEISMRMWEEFRNDPKVTYDFGEYIEFDDFPDWLKENK